MSMMATYFNLLIVDGEVTVSIQMLFWLWVE